MKDRPPHVDPYRGVTLATGGSRDRQGPVSFPLGNQDEVTEFFRRCIGAFPLVIADLSQLVHAATEQMSLEAGAAGDSVKETGSLEAAAPSVDIARERVARTAAAVRECPEPPDVASAQHLAAALDALDEFRAAERFDDWVQAWCRAMEHRDAFIRAFAIANGQRA